MKGRKASVTASISNGSLEESDANVQHSPSLSKNQKKKLRKKRNKINKIQSQERGTTLSAKDDQPLTPNVTPSSATNERENSVVVNKINGGNTSLLAQTVNQISNSVQASTNTGTEVLHQQLSRIGIQEVISELEKVRFLI